MISIFQLKILDIGHPIVLASVAENNALYKLVANRNGLLAGEINGNFISDKGASTNEIGKKAFEVINDYILKQKASLIEELDSFSSKGRLEQDLVGIYMAAIKGKAKKLIVYNDYYQEAIIQEGTVTINSLNSDNEGYVEDLVNEIIYQVMRYGGQVVFTEKETLKQYDPIVLITRF